MISLLKLRSQWLQSSAKKTGLVPGVQRPGLTGGKETTRNLANVGNLKEFNQVVNTMVYLGQSIFWAWFPNLGIANKSL